MTWETTLGRLASLPQAEYLFVFGATWLAMVLLTRRSWLSAAAVFAIGIGWLSIYLPLSVYLQSLSADSFVEAREFSFDEARFWLATLAEGLHPEFSRRKFLLYVGVAVASFVGLRLVLGRGVRLWTAIDRVQVPATLALMVASLYLTSADGVAVYVENSEGSAVTARNFSQPPPALTAPRHGLDLVVYVGESTSVMNMGVYGYPRDTTPRLSKLAGEDDRLLLFRHVFSTHSHTSRSLLEALSLGVDGSEDVMPIAKRRRIPLPDALGQAGVQTRLLSNQYQRGAWEQAATVIFSNVENRRFRIAQMLAARKAGTSEPPRWDDEFFAAEFDRGWDASAGPGVTFLHSYAGHGPYLENVPPGFHAPVDDRLSRLPAEAVLEDARHAVANVEAYDSAIRYVDHSVARMIERVRDTARPVVLVYFSDHGDEVFSNRGHDSARFRHEMLRIPFLMYFNDAARREQPALFARYQALARSGEIATLAQLPATLLELLGSVPREPKSARMVLLPAIGERIEPSPVLIREQASEVTYLDLRVDPGARPSRTPDGKVLVAREDEDTRRFLERRRVDQAVSTDCSRHSTFEALSREIRVGACRLAEIQGPARRRFQAAGP